MLLPSGGACWGKCVETGLCDRSAVRVSPIVGLIRNAKGVNRQSDFRKLLEASNRLRAQIVRAARYELHSI